MTRYSLLLTLALAACGGPNLAESSGFLEAYHERVCETAHACRASFPVMQSFEDSYGASEGECGASLLVDPLALEASVSAGRIVYSAADAEACLAAIEATPCAQFFDEDYLFDLPPYSGCATTLTPKVDDGGACATDFDCVGADGYCDAGACSNNK
jgi:hypothetical protein